MLIGKSSPKKSAVYLEKPPRNSGFSKSIINGQMVVYFEL